MTAHPILAIAFLGMRPEARDVIDHIEQVACVVASLTMGFGAALWIGITKGLGLAALGGIMTYLLSIVACLLLLFLMSRKKRESLARNRGSDGD